MLKKHTIVIDVNCKIMIVCFLVFALVFLPVFYSEHKSIELQQQVDNICASPTFYTCEDLELASPYCFGARNYYETKNCSKKEKKYLIT